MKITTTEVIPENDMIANMHYDAIDCKSQEGVLMSVMSRNTELESYRFRVMILIDCVKDRGCNGLKREIILIIACIELLEIHG